MEGNHDGTKETHYARSRTNHESRTMKTGDRGYFAKIPLLLLNDDREGITSYTLAVYAAIQSYTTFGKTTGAHPNAEQIATRAHCSVATVERERNRLKELGYMTWIPGSLKRRRGNDYTLSPSHRGDSSLPIPSHRGDHSPPTEGINPLPQREHREPVTENQEQREPVESPSRPTCYHPDDKFCRNCLTATVVFRPVPKSEPQDDEDF